jgi:capsular exopolysaccharide synthesis family protein
MDSAARRENMSDKRQLIVHQDSKSPIAEAYRTLRTNIQFVKAGEAVKTIMFTSTGPGEGKSTTAANLAVAMAQSGKKTVIIDCDMRKPVQHRIFGKRNKGVTNYLVESMDPTSLLIETEVRNLYLIPSGPIPPNPSELLSSAKMLELLDALKEQADFIVIDAPPTIAVTDACVLASKVDGVVLVLCAGQVRPEMAQKAKELITRARGHILGVILNRVEIDSDHAYYYYYYGSANKIAK